MNVERSSHTRITDNHRKICDRILSKGPRRTLDSCTRLCSEIMEGAHNFIRLGYDHSGSTTYKDITVRIKSIVMNPMASRLERLFLLKFLIESTYNRCNRDLYAMVKLGNWFDHIFSIIHPDFLFREMYTPIQLGTRTDRKQHLHESLSQLVLRLHKKWAPSLSKTSLYSNRPHNKIAERLISESKRCIQKPGDVNWVRPDEQTVQMLRDSLRSISILHSFIKHIRSGYAVPEGCVSPNDMLMAWIAVLGCMGHDKTSNAVAFGSVLYQVVLFPLLASYITHMDDRFADPVVSYITRVASGEGPRCFVCSPSTASFDALDFKTLPLPNSRYHGPMARYCITSALSCIPGSLVESSSAKRIHLKGRLISVWNRVLKSVTPFFSKPLSRMRVMSASNSIHSAFGIVRSLEESLSVMKEVHPLLRLFRVRYLNMIPFTCKISESLRMIRSSKNGKDAWFHLPESDRWVWVQSMAYVDCIYAKHSRNIDTKWLFEMAKKAYFVGGSGYIEPGNVWPSAEVYPLVFYSTMWRRTKQVSYANMGRSIYESLRDFSQSLVQRSDRTIPQYDPRLCTVFADPAFGVYVQGLVRGARYVLRYTLNIPVWLRDAFGEDIGRHILTFLGSDRSVIHGLCATMKRFIHSTLLPNFYTRAVADSKMETLRSVSEWLDSVDACQTYSL